MVHPDLQSQSGPTPLTPAPRLYAGKYASDAELEKAHEHLQSTLTERNQRILELENRLASQGQAPANQTPDYRSSLGEVGVPPEAVEQAAAQVFEKMFMPYFNGQSARHQAMQRHPILAEQEDNVVKFLEANPEKLQQFQNAWQAGLYGMAYDWAANEYQQALQAQGQASPPTTPNRMDGMMPPPGSGRALQQNPDAGNEKAAMDWFNRTGQAAELIKARLNATQFDHFQRGRYGS